MTAHADLVIVANRLPVDRVEADDGTVTWRRSPGGLVAAIEPVMQERDGVWIGWAGGADDHDDLIEVEGLRLVPVSMSADEIEGHYEGFLNSTIWPLYHDVIVKPAIHRE